MRVTHGRAWASNLIVLASGVGVLALACMLPRDRPGDLDSARPKVPQEPAAVGLVDLAEEPGPPGCFAVRRRPDGRGIRPSQPWAGLLVVGAAQVELAGRWYPVVGPGNPGDTLAGELVFLEGEKPDGGPWPFRIAPEGGQ